MPSVANIEHSRNIWGEDVVQEYLEITSKKRIGGYPTLSERDEYVEKHGNPNPSTRLLELFELNRQQKANSSLHK